MMKLLETIGSTCKSWLDCACIHTRQGLLLLWLTLLCAPASAAGKPDAEILLVLSELQGPYQVVANSLQDYLQDTSANIPLKMERVSADSIGSRSLTSARLVVAIGSKASEQVDAMPESAPVLHLLIPSQGNTLCDHPHHSAIFIDQPWQRQLNLIHLTLPGSEHIGLLLGNTSQQLRPDLEAAIIERQWYARVGIAPSNSSYLDALKRILEHSEVLLAIPDQQVFNRQNLQGILLTSYRREVPMIGFSPGYVRAGALAAVYSTPEQIAQQAAQWIDTLLEHAGRVLPAPAHPQYYSVAVNQQVARSLGLRVPQESTLLQYMQQLEEPQ